MRAFLDRGGLQAIIGPYSDWRWGSPPTALRRAGLMTPTGGCRWGFFFIGGSAGRGERRHERREVHRVFQARRGVREAGLSRVPVRGGREPQLPRRASVRTGDR